MNQMFKLNLSRMTALNSRIHLCPVRVKALAGFFYAHRKGLVATVIPLIGTSFGWVRFNSHRGRFLAILETLWNSAVTTFALRTPLGGTPTDATDTARQIFTGFFV